MSIVQAQNMPNQAQNTIRDDTKNSPKIQTQNQHSEFWVLIGFFFLTKNLLRSGQEM